ncbi:MAG: hypothetical protein JXP73_14865 [Deltaproteobacteria bacterium]|nr:hypothetical protein [Deltaproteobacteria bacterium]
MRNIVCLACLALVTACGASSDAPSLPDAAEPLADAAIDAGGSTVGAPDSQSVAPGCEHVSALCAKLWECAPFFLKAGYGDLAGCMDRLTKACTEQYKSNGSGLNQAGILACATSLATASCNDIFANNLPACGFRGAYPDGAVCGDNSQCASGFCSHNGSLCGICAAKGASGAPCPSGSNDECQTGLVCSPGKLCATPAPSGGACDENTAPCLLGTFCTTAGTCARTVEAGVECPGAFLDLSKGTLCFGKSTDANPMTAGQIGTAGVGQACGLAPAEGVPATLCAPGGVAACTLTAGSISLLGLPTKGICAALTQDGYTCAATSQCMAAAQCISGTCQIPSGRYCE